MRPTHHMLISAGVTALFSVWIKNSAGLLACFLSGIFIDLDHHLDYLLIKKELPLSYSKLVHFFNDDDHSKLYLIFHSYELLAILWISIFAFHLNSVWLGVAVGFTTHIMCDEVVNPLRPLSYFLTYRVKHNFSRKMFFKEDHDNVNYKVKF